jgi:hypothetical protein
VSLESELAVVARSVVRAWTPVWAPACDTGDMGDMGDRGGTPASASWRPRVVPPFDCCIPAAPVEVRADALVDAPDAE